MDLPERPQARLIDTDAFPGYCPLSRVGPLPQNEVALGFVEGLNNTVRVIQRRAYGLRGEEYLRLKILTCQLPEL
jgi:hypothetical protein